MVSKTKQAIDYLELLPEPNYHDVLNIAEKVKSSERTVYRALKQLRAKRQNMALEYSFVMGLMSDVIFLMSFLKKETVLKGELSVVSRKRLDAIGLLIETFNNDMDFQGYLKLREESEPE